MGVISDNVLHNLESYVFNCNTLSEAQYDKDPPTKTTSGFPFYRDTLLDDQTVGCRNAVRRSIGSQVSGRNRVLQQLHSQWFLVYPSFDTPLRKKRTVVLPRYRFFPRRNTDENPCFTDQRKPRRDECGDAREDASMPLPRGAGESVAKGRHHPGKNGTMSGILCQGSSQVSQSAPGVGGSAFTEKLFSRDGSAGSGRVYPKPGFQFQAVGRKCVPKQKCDRESGTDRALFRATRSKKNDANCGALALKVLSTALRQLSMDTSPAALFHSPRSLNSSLQGVYAPAESDFWCRRPGKRRYGQ